MSKSSLAVLALLVAQGAAAGPYDEARAAAEALLAANPQLTDDWPNPSGTFGGRQNSDFVGFIPANSAAGLLPDIKMMDGPQGLRNMLSGTTLPDRIAWASSGSLGMAWSRDMAYAYGYFGVDDFKAVDANVALLPGTNMHRLPTCGRNWEYLTGEEATLGVLAGDVSRGMQAKDVLVTIKHWILNNQEHNRRANIARIDETTLMETYARGYKDSIDSGAGGVMCSYNLVQRKLPNGALTGSAYACGDEYSGQHLLRDIFGFKGVLLSDWSAGFEKYNSQDAPAGEGRSVSDWEMIWAGWDGEQIRRPLDSAQRKAAVLNSLTGLYASGVLKPEDGTAVKAPVEAPEAEPTLPAAYRAAMDRDDGDKAAYGAALVAESMVMLKNDGGTLPLGDMQGKSVLLLGEAMLSGGGSGDSSPFGYLFPGNSAQDISNNGGRFAQDLMRDTLEATLQGSTVQWDFEAPGADPADFDLVIAFGAQYRAEEYLLDNTDGYYDISRCDSGRNVTQDHRDGIISDPYGDCDYAGTVLAGLQAARAAGTTILSVTTVGGGFRAHDFVPLVDAALTMFYPGQFFAEGLAQVLSGKISPGGKLIITVPDVEERDGEEYLQSPVARFNEGLKPTSLRTRITTPGYLWDPVGNKRTNVIQYGTRYSDYAEKGLIGYKYFEKYNMKPLFPFGFGLEYDTWSVAADFAECTAPGACKVSVTATKTARASDTIGSTVLQVYVGYVSTDGDNSVTPVKELRDFRKVWDTTTATFDLGAMEYAWDEDKEQWRTPCDRDGSAGTFLVLVGTSSKDIAGMTRIDCKVTSSSPATTPSPTTNKATVAPTESIDGGVNSDGGARSKPLAASAMVVALLAARR